MGELIGHVVAKHHRYLREELPRLERSLIEIEGERSRAAALARRLRREIEGHLLREELVLFPLIGELARRRASGEKPERRSFGSLRNPIAFMQQDHQIEDGLLGGIAQSLARDRDGGCAERLQAIASDLREHVRLEEEVLFPWAVRLEER